ncbi:MAG: hypothetical protein ACI4MI_05335 [Christensenellales bacterium]
MQEFNESGDKGLVVNSVPNNEINPVPSNDKYVGKEKQVATVATSTLLAIAALLLGSGVAMTSDAAVDAYITALDSTETQITWSVETDAQAQGLIVEAYNDFTHRSVAIDGGQNSGSFDNLKSGMEYTVAVYIQDGNNKQLLTKQKIKTKRE